MQANLARHPRSLHPTEHAHSQIVVHAAVGKREPTKLARIGPDLVPLQFKRRKETRKRGRSRDGHGYCCQTRVDSIKVESLPRTAPLHDQAIAREPAQAALAEIRRQNAEPRLFGQLKQARIAVQVFLVVVLQEAGPSQLAAWTAKRQPAQRAQRHGQRKAAHHAIANVELYKPN